MKIINGKNLVPHNGVCEASNCGACGEIIDWANDVMFGENSGRAEDDVSCPFCGHGDTAWMQPRIDNSSLVIRVSDRAIKKRGMK